MGNVFTSINLITGTTTVVKANLGINVNAIGYNTLDNLIYGIETGTNRLVVIDSNGNIGHYGPVLNLPTPTVNYEVGAIDNAGHLFIMESNTNKMYTINVDTSSANFGMLVDPALGYALDVSPYGTTLSSSVNITDWAINATDGFLYSVNPSGVAVRVNQVTGAVTTLTTTGLPANTYGPIYSFSGGGIYATNNTTGGIYNVTISGNNATGSLFSTDATTTANDGASCLNAVIALDFGDAPDVSLTNEAYNYKTVLASNGPRHGVNSSLTLGTAITSETDAYQNTTATGDDLIQGIQDDGPVTIPLTALAYNANTYTFSLRVNNNTGRLANVYAWLDFNQNGIFETNEGFTTTVPSSASLQTITVTFNRPAGGSNFIGNTFVRVRLTTDTLTNSGGATSEDTRSFGPASDGEVEDYILKITSAPFTCNVVGYRVSS